MLRHLRRLTGRVLLAIWLPLNCVRFLALKRGLARLPQQTANDFPYEDHPSYM